MQTLGKNNTIQRLVAHDKDPRDVSANGFNRFDPKYVSIGPKAIRAAGAMTIKSNKCATLRHGGRYGGSLTIQGQPLQSNLGVKATNVSVQLKTAAPPSVATVSKEYDIQSKSYMDVHDKMSTLPYNKQEKVSNVNKNLMGSHTLGRKTVTNQLGAHDDKHMASVFSIEASAVHHNMNKNKNLHMTKGISILNQPLPEIPQQAAVEQVKNAQQPLSAANLAQYRSLQRPSKQQNHNSARETSNVSSFSTIRRGQGNGNKVVPPTLPPKNRYKDEHRMGRSSGGTMKERMDQTDAGQYTHQPSAIKPSKSIPTIRNQLSTFGAERDHHHMPETVSRNHHNLGYGEPQPQQFSTKSILSNKNSRSHQHQQQQRPPLPQHQNFSTSTFQQQQHHKKTSNSNRKSDYGEDNTNNSLYYCQQGPPRTSGVDPHQSADLYSVTEL